MKMRSAMPLSITAVLTLLLTVADGRADDWALLIGASQYPNLPQERSLRGPTNDVELMRSVLLDARMGFREDHITVLSGWPAAVTARPTRVNILQAFLRMSAKSKSGDQVFVLFSGHGSQQPDHPDPADIESDGLDEIFLPADISAWDEEAGTVKNALVDDEVHAWTETLVKKGVFVWMVFDSCNSGTMTRDVAIGERQIRRVDMRDLIPESVLAKVQIQPAANRGASAPAGAFDLATGSGGLVAIYAAQPYETTFETPMPGKTGKVHGMLTYTIAQSLMQAEGTFTYRQLADRIMTIYRTIGVAQPTPFIEGTALDRVVLRREVRDERSHFLLTGNVTPQGYEMNAGTLHSLRPGTILEVFPPAGLTNSEISLGFVTVAVADSVVSSVIPTASAGRPAPGRKDLGIETRCRIVQEAFDLPPLRVAVQIVAGTSGVMRVCQKDTLPSPIAGLLKTLSACGLADVTYTAEDADWFLRLDGKQGTLVPGTGWQSGNGKPPVFQVGDPTDDKTFSAALRDRLTRIARALRLLRISGDAQPGSNRTGATRVTVDLLRYDKPDSPSAQPLAPGPSGRVLRSGDTIAFRVANPSAHPIDVTLLFIDSSYGIQALFPEPGTVDDNRLMPGQERITPKVTVTADTVGAEQLVAIAVKASAARVDFSCLQQEAMDRTRGARALNESPLGKLLVDAMFDEGGGTRGLKRAPLPQHHTLVIPWQTLPAD